MRIEQLIAEGYTTEVAERIVIAEREREECKKFAALLIEKHGFSAEDARYATTAGARTVSAARAMLKKREEHTVEQPVRFQSRGHFAGHYD